MPTPLGRVRAFMPPQGLLVVAAWLPDRWSIRFVDENMRRTEPSEFAWADVVFVSGMHIQADQIGDLQLRAIDPLVFQDGQPDLF